MLNEKPFYRSGQSSHFNIIGRCSKPESRPKIRSMASELKTAARKAEERADGMLAEPALGLKRFRSVS